MSVAEKTCRTCGKAYVVEDGAGLCPLYNSLEYETEIKMALEEFDIWNLNISQNDGLPQKICLTCFDSFCQIHNFRLMCLEAQMNFSEMCTGLDIIIQDDNISDEEYDFNVNGESSVIVQEHYTFPGDERLKKPTTSTEESNDIDSHEDAVDETINREDFDYIIEKEEEKLDGIPTEENGETEQQEKVEKPKTANGTEEENEIHLRKYLCEYCMYFESFDDADDLNSHYNEMHSTVLPYPCPKCDLRFDKLAKRNSHVRSHFDVIPLECKYCSKKIRGDSVLMAQHVAYFHIEKDRECPECQLKFQQISLDKYYYHMKWHNESKLRKCKFCDKKFIQSPHLHMHERTHTGETKFVCKECGLGCKTMDLLKKHILLHENKELIECPKCPKRYFTKPGLKLHNQKTHHPDKKPSICKICDKTFQYNHDLVIHNHKKHDGPVPKLVRRTGKPITAACAALRVIKKQKKRDFVKPFKCDKCEEAYVLEEQLKRHVKVHDEYRPHTCKFCSKSFKRDAHLKLHVNNIHFNRKPYKCSICGAAFVQKSHLTDHTAIRHENKRNYQCKVCHKKFGTCQILKTHMLIHSNDRPYICSICDKGFKQLMVLKSHMTYMHYWKSEDAEKKLNKVKNEIL
ncbi:zinc finger protein 502-like [Episyrphus balteatus]|uniref:zinc finger protein 502-like n=1 Tax=Episyrphus balteatus TaxID=286459 RepID=UPI0024869ADC|nr:zinc finger protein 502-like [Episyrphus balteatus]